MPLYLLTNYVFFRKAKTIGERFTVLIQEKENWKKFKISQGY